MNYLIQISDNYLSIVPSGELGIETEIPNNRLIHVTVKAGLSGYIFGETNNYSVLKEDYDFWFTTQYCPLFSTPKKVKLMAGPEADNFLDDTIYRMIYKNSLDGVELWNLNTTQEMSSESWGCPASNVPFRLKKYVECKTAYDLLTLLDQNGSNITNGGQTKTLGDMTVSYTGSPGGAGSEAPDRKKELFDCWNEMLRSFRSQWAAVRGYFDESKGYSHPVRDLTANRLIKTHWFNTNHEQTPGTSTYRRTF